MTHNVDTAGQCPGKKKKVLWIGNFEPPYRVPFYKLMAERYDITMVLFQTREEQTIRDPKWFFGGERNYKIEQIGTKRILGKKVALDLRRWINKEGWDMVFMGMYGDISAAYAIGCLRRRKIPFGLGVDGMLSRDGESRLRWHIKKWLLEKASFVMSPSDSTDECLRGYTVSPKRIFRYHFTPLTEADIAAAAPPGPDGKRRLRERLGIESKGRKVFLYVGQMIHRKGIDITLRVASRFRDEAEFYLVGGSATEEYSRLQKELEAGNVHFVGFKTKAELTDWYEAADAFLFPTREDIWGLAVNEAMASSLPVITTNRCVAGIALIEDGVDGYLVPVDDVDATGDAVGRLLAQPANFEAFGQESRRRITDYTSERMAQAYTSAFEKFMAGKQG